MLLQWLRSCYEVVKRDWQENEGYQETLFWPFLPLNTFYASAGEQNFSQLTTSTFA